MREADKRRFLSKHEDLLRIEPKKQAQKTYATSVSFFKRLPFSLKIIATLLFFIIVIIVIPFMSYAIYDTWNNPPHRARLFHSFAVFLMGFVPFVIVYVFYAKQV
jgi:nitrogen fixation/metabolism regulation signal transduction histidine kinase